MKHVNLDNVDLTSAIAEYKKSGVLTYSVIREILGDAPHIPDSPDNDARMDAYEERAEYGRQARLLEDKIKEIVAKEEGG